MDLATYRDFSKVVIIDDVYPEGEAIRDALRNADIASLVYHITDISEGSTCLPSAPLKNVGLVFLDLEYGELAANDGAHANIALRSLQRVVGSRSSYILVLWSSQTSTQIKDEFIKGLYRLDDIGKPLTEPILFDKAEFKENGSLDAVLDDIYKLFAKFPLSTVLIESERLSLNAAGETIDQLIRDKDEGGLEKIMNALSMAYGSSTTDSNRKIQNALMVISSLFYDSIESELIGHDFTPVELNETARLTPLEKAKLNTQLMFSNEADSGGSGSINEAAIDNEIVVKFFSQPKAHYEDLEPDFFNTQVLPVTFDLTPLCDSAQGRQIYYIAEGVLFPCLLYTSDAADE